MNATLAPLTLCLALLAAAPAQAQGIRQQSGSTRLTHVVRQANDELRPRIEAQRQQLTETDDIIDQIYRELQARYAAGVTPEIVPQRAHQLETPHERTP